MAEPPFKRSRPHRTDSREMWDDADSGRPSRDARDPPRDPRDSHERRRDFDRDGRRRFRSRSRERRDWDRRDGRYRDGRDRDRDRQRPRDRDWDRGRRDKNRSRSPRRPSRSPRREGYDERRGSPSEFARPERDASRGAPRPVKGTIATNIGGAQAMEVDAQTASGRRNTVEEPNIVVDDEVEVEDDAMAAMQAMMGFGGFGTTKQKKVPGNNVSAVRKEKRTEYRQYMNRVGGFNRALSPPRE